MGFSDPLATGVGTLIKKALQSLGFVSGSTGWQITRLGNAEFNSGTFRGTIVVGPASGQRIVIDSTAGTITMYDSGGNVVAVWDSTGQNFTVYKSGTSQHTYARLDTSGTIAAALELNPDSTAYETGYIVGSGAGILINSPRELGAGHTSSLSVTGSVGATPGTIEMTPDSGWVTIDGGASVSTAMVKLVGVSRATWQTPSYNSGWSGNTTFNTRAGYQTFQYRLDAEDNVHLNGSFKCTNAAGSANVITLPAGYRPSATQPVFLQRNSGGTLTEGTAIIDSGGNFGMVASGGMGRVTNDEYLVDTIFPLNTIP